MNQAVIVSVARTPIELAPSGTLNAIKSPILLGHVIEHAVLRSGIQPTEIDDVVAGMAMGGGAAGLNVTRNAAFAAGLGVGVSCQTIDRQCTSGFMAVATAAKQIIVDGMRVVVAGSVENMSAVQRPHGDLITGAVDYAVTSRGTHADIPMLRAAEFLAKKYGISRRTQDQYALESHRRAAAALAAGRFDAEIAPITSHISTPDQDTGDATCREVTLVADECIRADATFENLAALPPLIEGGSVTVGNASQPSSGAAACVLMDGELAVQHCLKPLGIYRGIAVAGVAPELMGIGPVLAVPKLLKQHGLTIDDIGLWEFDEASACQAWYCRHKLGIDPARYNVNGGGVSLGHSTGMSGIRLVGHALLEGRRRCARYVVVAMSAVGGLGVAGLFEVMP